MICAHMQYYIMVQCCGRPQARVDAGGGPHTVVTLTVRFFSSIGSFSSSAQPSVLSVALEIFLSSTYKYKLFPFLTQSDKLLTKVTEKRAEHSPTCVSAPDSSPLLFSVPHPLSGVHHKVMYPFPIIALYATPLNFFPLPFMKCAWSEAF